MCEVDHTSQRIDGVAGPAFLVAEQRERVAHHPSLAQATRCLDAPKAYERAYVIGVPEMDPLLRRCACCVVELPLHVPIARRTRLARCVPRQATRGLRCLFPSLQRALSLERMIGCSGTAGLRSLTARLRRPLGKQCETLHPPLQKKPALATTAQRRYGMELLEWRASASTRSRHLSQLAKSLAGKVDACQRLQRSKPSPH